MPENTPCSLPQEEPEPSHPILVITSEGESIDLLNLPLNIAAELYILNQLSQPK